MSAKASFAAIQLPEASPLRRTRSQAQREQAQAAAAAAAEATSAPAAAASVAGPAPSTPRRVRTRASVAAAAASGVTLSPTLTVADHSPSLRVRTATAFHSMQHRIDDASVAIKQSCTRYQLLAYDHCPEWLKDNRYIRSGYRANIGWRQSVESACHMHNETINVWTHIIAFLIMTMLLVMTMSVLSPHGVDRLDLDVVLSSRYDIPPQCHTDAAAALEGGAMDPACVAPAPTTGSDRAFPPHSADPLEELHRLLGDSQDEMLVELVSRVQTLLPSLEGLTSSLKERASQLQDSLLSAMPEQASRNLRQLSEDGSVSLSEYMHGVEKKLADLKAAASAVLVTPGTQAAGDAVAAEYAKWRDTLKGAISDLSRDFSPALLLETSKDHNLDLVQVTRSMIANFMQQAHLDAKGISISPSMEQVPGIEVQIKVKNGAAGLLGKPTTSTTVPAVASQASLAPLAGVDSEADSLTPSQLPRTEFDADGGGKTVSTSIGYLSVAVHTRSSNPGQVELQLHSYLPRYPLAVFLVTAMMCLAFSSTYHLMQAVSDEWARRFQALDYAGIVLLIAGSTTPIIYYGFYCAPILRLFYILIVWCLGVFVFTIVVLPMYRAPQYRVLKTSCFVALGFSGTIPLMHFQWHLGSVHFILFWMLGMGACYLAGAAIYVTQVPERWWPGYFDYIGSSHQLWHLSIFAAVLVHYVGLIHMFEWRMTRVCTPSMFS